MTSRPDVQTVERAKTGDQRAYRLLYETHRPRVYSTVIRYVRNEADAEDLVQMTFIRAFEGIGRFRGDAAFSTWITRIALNVSHSHHQWVSAQKRCASPGFEAWPEPVSPDDPEQALHLSECRRQVLRMIRSLPRRYRRAMALRYVSDCSYAEIEATMAIPIGTVKTWLWRGRQILKETTEQDRPEAA